MSELILKDVHKRYGNVQAVCEFSLEVASGEFVVLVGPSGCGKSTTLRMVAGLEDVSDGEILIGERDVTHLSPRERDVAMVFQSYALYPHMSVYDNLAFGLRNRNTPEDRVLAEVNQVAEVLGISQLLDRRPAQLSGGQQQRVALGRCMVRRPSVFLFDEPLSNLDAKLRAQMRLELKRLREQPKTTTLYVTHDQLEAMTLGDRVVIMRDGFIQQIGTPLEIYSQPVNRFVAGFIGLPAMNFIEGELSRQGEAWDFQGGGLRLPTPPPWAEPPEHVVLGIRPEHIRLAEPTDGADASISARVDVIEQTGADLLIEVVCGETLLTVSRLDPELTIRTGDIVDLTLAPDKIYFFDAGDESALPASSQRRSP